jgi:hypothetical protein
MRALSNPLLQVEAYQSAFVTGITAPIGVAFSWGKKRKVLGGYERDSRGGHSLSLFVPIVDIGAAFSYRWSQGDEINGFPKIKFLKSLRQVVIWFGASKMRLLP